jgi:hypothetical protein
MLSVNVVHVNTKHHLRPLGFEPWWEGRFVLQVKIELILNNR